MNWLRTSILLVTLSLSLPVLADGIPAKLYKNPNCGCCEEYAKYLRANGYDVEVIPTPDLPAIKRTNKVPDKLEACHTMLVGPYVVEGHVPVESINRLLKEHPVVRGLAVPGMPAGSPGMSGAKRGPLEVYYLGDSRDPKVFESR